MTIKLKIGGATTGRKFTDPIRYFKANDPYYWEVDNIPLKQLQENVRYVNDRLNTAIVSGTLDVSRQDITELKPWVNGSDNKVRVKGGRYTARINNAHDIDRLDSFVRKSSSEILGNHTNYAWTSNSFLDNLLARAQSAAGAAALNLNGLSERVFGQIARNPNEVVDPMDEDPLFPRTPRPLPSTEALLGPSGKGTGVHSYFGDALPISEHLSLFQVMRAAPNFNSGTTGASLFLTPTQANGDPNRLLFLPVLENALIKYWRGTARTSIVDVPNGLEIAIPDFDASIDFPGVAGATSRIDLVFIYSKPIDTSAVTIGKYTGGTTGASRTKIREPILGVLRGAGIGVSPTPSLGAEPVIDVNGISKMVASVADQSNTDSGFKVGVNQPNQAIHGSFPSPEDLLNIAPLLSEQLQEDSWFLTGQTIFPVAYVKVNENPGVNVQGTSVLTDDDIVDIRPLFRTAELTYNERAGIAAAMPSLSLANRAVGRYELEHELNMQYESVDARLIELEKIKSATVPIEKTVFWEPSHGTSINNVWGQSAAPGSRNSIVRASRGDHVNAFGGDPASKVQHEVQHMIPTAHRPLVKYIHIRVSSFWNWGFQGSNPTKPTTVNLQPAASHIPKIWAKAPSEKRYARLLLRHSVMWVAGSYFGNLEHGGEPVVMMPVDYDATDDSLVFETHMTHWKGPGGGGNTMNWPTHHQHTELKFEGYTYLDNYSASFG